MFIEYVQFLTQREESSISNLLNGPLPWIVGGVLVILIFWTVKK